MSKKTTLILAFFAALTLASCARMEPVDTIEIGDDSFRDWVARHDPKAQPLTKDSVVFRRFITRGAPDAQILEPGKYVYLNYTMSTLNGTYFISRDSLISRLTGTWKNTTHWCEDYMSFYSENGFFSPGVYNGLKGLRSGDSVRLYISSTASYSSSAMVANTAYLSASASTYMGFPIICDVKIGAINTNPARAAVDRVDKYAAEKWGMTTKDSLKAGLYMRIIKHDLKGDSVSKEGSVSLYYKQTFTDGFLLATNSDSIAKVYNRYDAQNTSYNLISVPVKAGTGNFDAFYAYVLPKLRYGDVVELITIPFYTMLGNSGSFYTAPQILSYQPTVFTLYTQKPKEADGKSTTN